MSQQYYSVWEKNKSTQENEHLLYSSESSKSSSAVLQKHQSQQVKHKRYGYLQPLRPTKEDGQHQHIYLFK